MIFKYLLFIVLGYMSGSILFGYLIPKILFKVDTIKNSADSNPGTANSFKLGGVACGIMVLVLDIVKGFVPIFIANNVVEENHFLFSLVMLAPVVGHAFPLFTGFKKGGKCIAVTFGVLLGLFPHLTLALSLAFWYVFFSIIVIINPHCLRSVVTFVCWLASAIFFAKTLSLFIGCASICAIVILKHLKSLKETEERKVRLAFQKI